jgi:Flp pilus assembly protein TadD
VRRGATGNTSGWRTVEVGGGPDPLRHRGPREEEIVQTTLYDRYTLAQDHFEQRDYLRAAEILEAMLAEASGGGVRHGVTDARLLLARAYYHAARLGPAERTAREVLAEDPTDGYAALLLARSLERQSRLDEADRARRLAEALGAPA